MKKLAALILTLLFIMPASGLCDSEISPFILLANYASWAKLLGVPDFSDEVESGSTDDGFTLLNSDVLAIKIDAATFNFNSAFLVYRYPGFDDADMDLRALALFIALEYGKPQEFSLSELKEARSAYIHILDALKKAETDNAQQIENNEIVPFYFGIDAVYCIYQSPDGNRLIYIE